MVEVNEYLQTRFPNVYACGDVAGPYQFTHTAAHQAWYAAVNALFGSFWKFKVRRMGNDRIFASNVFRSDPEYPFACGRYDRMIELVDAATAPLTTDDVSRILDEVDIPWNNVQSMIFLPETKEILLAAGELPAAGGRFAPLGLWD